MFSPEARAVYSRLLILCVLCVCLFILGRSTNVKAALAAPCTQDCEAWERACYDECAQSCNGNGDPSCSSCMLSCSSDFMDCAEHSVWCQSGTVSYAPQCQVYYTNHCPINPSTGQGDCSLPGAHSGYTLVCETLGGNHCIACPDDGWHCTGASGLNPCY